MLDIVKFREWLNNRGYGAEVFLFQMPESGYDEAIAFNVGQGMDSKGTVDDMVLNCYARANSPGRAVKITSKINSDLNMRTKVFIGDTQIILIKPITAVPLPLGTDENKRHMFQVQFKMLVSQTDKLNLKS